MNPGHCLDLIRQNLPDLSTRDQVKLFKTTDDKDRIEETIASFNNAGDVRHLYRRLCAELGVAVNQKSQNWNMNTLTKHIVNLMTEQQG